MSTRRVRQLAFDHGAPYVQVRDAGFAAFAMAAVSSGAAAAWPDRETVVGVPGMSSLVRPLTEGVTQVSSCRVREVKNVDGGWRLATDGASPGAASWDWVVVAVPAPQAAPLLAASPDLAAAAAEVRMAPRWVAMAAFDRSLKTPSAAAVGAHAVLHKVVCEGAKPGRRAPGCWVLHASPEWSRANLERDAREVEGVLLASLRELVGAPAPVYQTAHRWRHARPETPLNVPFLVDAEQRLAACGDWCGGDGAEAAFLSGLALAGEVEVDLGLRAAP
jgi:predicted NAD/FAD-dependent oxidoreductase